MHAKEVEIHQEPKKEVKGHEFGPPSKVHDDSEPNFEVEEKNMQVTT
jgi:hypothetical protein